MPKGVKISEIEIGTGSVAERGLLAVVKLRLFLKGGLEVPGHFPTVPKTVVDLGRRDQLAGVRYGIEGMKAGGKRRFIMSPHLACGEQGWGASIPPNAALIAEVELLEVHDRGAYPQSEYRSGRYLHLFHPGSLQGRTPRWQLALHEDGDGSILITPADRKPGWREIVRQEVAFDVDPKIARALVEEALAMPAQHPADCQITHAPGSGLWHPVPGTTPDQITPQACVVISVAKVSHPMCSYAVPDNSRVWLDSGISRTLLKWLQAKLAAACESLQIP